MGEHSDEMLKTAYLNNYYQTGLKNLLDIAVLEHAERKLESTQNYRKVDEIPFDFNRRRMSVVVAKWGCKLEPQKFPPPKIKPRHESIEVDHLAIALEGVVPVHGMAEGRVIKRWQLWNS